MKVPLNPSKGTSAEETSMGVIGLATTGGTFYNDLSTTDGDVALYNEGTTLDSCNGHSSSDNQYHYHATPACADSYANATACEFVGYARDGVPIYGYCNDATGTQFTSCYTISSGYSETELTIASGTYYSASMDTYYELGSDCNLDEANGIGSIKFSKRYSNINFFLHFRCHPPNNWRVLLLFDHHLSMGS